MSLSKEEVKAIKQALSDLNDKVNDCLDALREVKDLPGIGYIVSETSNGWKESLFGTLESGIPRLDYTHRILLKHIETTKKEAKKCESLLKKSKTLKLK